MSALCGLGIDNIVIDITAEEVPILDGSSSSLCVLAAKCWRADAKGTQKIHRVLQPGRGA